MYEPTGRQNPYLCFHVAGSCRRLGERDCRVGRQAIRQSRRWSRRRPGGQRAEMGHAEQDRARIEDACGCAISAPSRTVSPLCFARHLRCTGRPLPMLPPGTAWSRRLRDAGLRRLFVSRLALGDRGHAVSCRSTTISPTSMCWSTSSAARRSDRALPGRLAVPALRRAISRQGPQAGAGRRADRHCRRTIRIVRARRCQPYGVVP